MSRPNGGRLRPLMVLGCTSSAGKSLLVTALCRWFAREGIDVAPFKAQNMSNNARVVTGGEIGVAQWLQSQAAGVEPTVDMNPVLVKPEADTRSQVVVQGRRDPDVSALPWEQRHEPLWSAMAESFERVRSAHDLVVLEGAGSPAEINLRDQVNNRVVAHTDAAALLVSDIDRGGSFAHLFGTWSLVPATTRDRLAGFVLNKFRGDASLLAPAPAVLTERTGMAHLGTLPMLDHELPDEEGARLPNTGPNTGPFVAIVRFPFGSNLDEFRLLHHAARVVWTDDPDVVGSADWIVLPGSKHVAADLAWMRRHRLDDAVLTAVSSGRRVHGVCGGAMMLGQRIDDPHSTESAEVSTSGLGVLPHRTTIEPDKLVGAATVTVDGLELVGYEIRHGRTAGSNGDALPTYVRSGNVSATTVHGLLEDPRLLDRWFGHWSTRRVVDPLPATFELLADAVAEHLDTDRLRRLVGITR
jgi:adenosylcobyric acid synthase